jgi:hypothetical protein
MLPYLKNGFYNEEETVNWLKRFSKQRVEKSDPNRVEKQKGVLKIYWSWNDYEGRQHEIGFNISEQTYERAIEFRKKYRTNGKSVGDLYLEFIYNSNDAIDSMVAAMRKDIQQKKLGGMEVLNYIVTAVQSPAYTKITHTKQCPCEDMGRKWLDDCNNVIPMAVYTPAEFIVQKTGDCDTKAVMAFALLKKMNFDVAILLGDVLDGANNPGKHAMLGVSNFAPVIPSKSLRYMGKIYHPWEVTSFELGNQLGNMAMWNGWRNWAVVCN